MRQRIINKEVNDILHATTYDMRHATYYMRHTICYIVGQTWSLEGLGCAAWCGVLGLGCIHTIYPFYCTIRVFFIYLFFCGIEERFLIMRGYDMIRDKEVCMNQKEHTRKTKTSNKRIRIHSPLF